MPVAGRAKIEDVDDETPGAQPGMQSLVRGLRLLDIVAGAPGPMRFSALQEGSGFPKGTLHRLVQTLIDERYLTETDRGYRLGARPFQLAHRVWDGFDLRAAAAPELRRLADTVGEAARLGVIEAGQVLYIDQCDAANEVRVGSAVGMRAPVHATALGKAIAAHLDEAGRRDVVASDLTRLTDATVTGVADLDRQLAVVKARGYAVNLGEAHDEVVGVAAPILDHRARPIGAVGIVGPAFRLSEERLHALGREVIEASRRISGNIGELAMSISVNQKPLHLVTDDVSIAVPGTDFLGGGAGLGRGVGPSHLGRHPGARAGDGGSVDRPADVAAPARADRLRGAPRGRRLRVRHRDGHPRARRRRHADDARRRPRPIDRATASTTASATAGDGSGSARSRSTPSRGTGRSGATTARRPSGCSTGSTSRTASAGRPTTATFYFTDSGEPDDLGLRLRRGPGRSPDAGSSPRLRRTRACPTVSRSTSRAASGSRSGTAGPCAATVPTARVDRDVTLPVPRPTSCAFGGPDRATLYVTTARIRLSAADSSRRRHRRGRSSPSTRAWPGFRPIPSQPEESERGRSYHRGPREALRHGGGAARHRPARRGRRVRRLRRPVGLREVDAAADDLRARRGDAPERSWSTARWSTTCPRPSAASRWCSSPTRSTPT